MRLGGDDDDGDDTTVEPLVDAGEYDLGEDMGGKVGEHESDEDQL